MPGEPVYPDDRNGTAYERVLRTAYLDPLVAEMQRAAAETHSARELLRRARNGDYTPDYPQGIPEEPVQAALERMRGWHDERLYQTFRSGFGVDIREVLRADGEVRAFLRISIQRNVALISSIPETAHRELEAGLDAILAQGGFDAQATQALVQRVGKVSARRLRLITRDQNAKLTGQLTQIRHRQLGIEEYRWSTSEDDRVRPTHVVMEGRRCKWAEAPLVGGERLHPGEDIQCRCAAIPLLTKPLRTKEQQEEAKPVLSKAELARAGYIAEDRVGMAAPATDYQQLRLFLALPVATAIADTRIAGLGVRSRQVRRIFRVATQWWTDFDLDALLDETAWLNRMFRAYEQVAEGRAWAPLYRYRERAKDWVANARRRAAERRRAGIGAEGAATTPKTPVQPLTEDIELPEVDAAGFVGTLPGFEDVAGDAMHMQPETWERLADIPEAWWQQFDRLAPSDERAEEALAYARMLMGEADASQLRMLDVTEADVLRELQDASERLRVRHGWLSYMTRRRPAPEPGRREPFWDDVVPERVAEDAPPRVDFVDIRAEVLRAAEAEISAAEAAATARGEYDKFYANMSDWLGIPVYDGYSGRQEWVDGRAMQWVRDRAKTNEQALANAEREWAQGRWTGWMPPGMLDVWTPPPSAPMRGEGRAGWLKRRVRELEGDNRDRLSRPALRLYAESEWEQRLWVRYDPTIAAGKPVYYDDTPMPRAGSGRRDWLKRQARAHRRRNPNMTVQDSYRYAEVDWLRNDFPQPTPPPIREGEDAERWIRRYAEMLRVFDEPRYGTGFAEARDTWRRIAFDVDIDEAGSIRLIDLEDYVDAGYLERIHRWEAELLEAYRDELGRELAPDEAVAFAQDLWARHGPGETLAINVADAVGDEIADYLDGEIWLYRRTGKVEDALVDQFRMTKSVVLHEVATALLARVYNPAMGRTAPPPERGELFAALMVRLYDANILHVRNPTDFEDALHLLADVDSVDWVRKQAKARALSDWDKWRFNDDTPLVRFIGSTADAYQRLYEDLPWGARTFRMELPRSGTYRQTPSRRSVGGGRAPPLYSIDRRVGEGGRYRPWLDMGRWEAKPLPRINGLTPRQDRLSMSDLKDKPLQERLDVLRKWIDDQQAMIRRYNRRMTPAEALERAEVDFAEANSAMLVKEDPDLMLAFLSPDTPLPMAVHRVGQSFENATGTWIDHTGARAMLEAKHQHELLLHNRTLTETAAKDLSTHVYYRLLEFQRPMMQSGNEQYFADSDLARAWLLTRPGLPDAVLDASVDGPPTVQGYTRFVKRRIKEITEADATLTEGDARAMAHIEWLGETTGSYAKHWERTKTMPEYAWDQVDNDGEYRGIVYSFQREMIEAGDLHDGRLSLDQSRDLVRRFWAKYGIGPTPAVIARAWQREAPSVLGFWSGELHMMGFTHRGTKSLTLSQQTLIHELVHALHERAIHATNATPDTAYWQALGAFEQHGQLDHSRTFSTLLLHALAEFGGPGTGRGPDYDAMMGGLMDDYRHFRLAPGIDPEMGYEIDPEDLLLDWGGPRDGLVENPRVYGLGWARANARLRGMHRERIMQGVTDDPAMVVGMSQDETDLYTPLQRGRYGIGPGGDGLEPDLHGDLRQQARHTGVVTGANDKWNALIADVRRAVDAIAAGPDDAAERIAAAEFGSKHGDRFIWYWQPIGPPTPEDIGTYGYAYAPMQTNYVPLPSLMMNRAVEIAREYRAMDDVPDQLLKRAFAAKMRDSGIWAPWDMGSQGPPPMHRFWDWDNDALLEFEQSIRRVDYANAYPYAAEEYIAFRVGQDFDAQKRALGLAEEAADTRYVGPEEMPMLEAAHTGATPTSKPIEVTGHTWDTWRPLRVAQILSEHQLETPAGAHLRAATEWRLRKGRMNRTGWAPPEAVAAREEREAARVATQGDYESLMLIPDEFTTEQDPVVEGGIGFANYFYFFEDWLRRKGVAEPLDAPGYKSADLPELLSRIWQEDGVSHSFPTITRWAQPGSIAMWFDREMHVLRPYGMAAADANYNRGAVLHEVGHALMQRLYLADDLNPEGVDGKLSSVQRAYSHKIGHTPEAMAYMLRLREKYEGLDLSDIDDHVRTFKAELALHPDKYPEVEWRNFHIPLDVVTDTQYVRRKLRARGMSDDAILEGTDAPFPVYDVPADEERGFQRYFTAAPLESRDGGIAEDLFARVGNTPDPMAPNAPPVDRIAPDDLLLSDRWRRWFDDAERQAKWRKVAEHVPPLPPGRPFDETDDAVAEATAEWLLRLMATLSDEMPGGARSFAPRRATAGMERLEAQAFAQALLMRRYPERMLDGDLGFRPVHWSVTGEYDDVDEALAAVASTLPLDEYLPAAMDALMDVAPLTRGYARRLALKRYVDDAYDRVVGYTDEDVIGRGERLAEAADALRLPVMPDLSVGGLDVFGWADDPATWLDARIQILTLYNPPSVVAESLTRARIIASHEFATRIAHRAAVSDLRDMAVDLTSYEGTFRGRDIFPRNPRAGESKTEWIEEHALKFAHVNIHLPYLRALDVAEFWWHRLDARQVLRTPADEMNRHLSHTENVYAFEDYLTLADSFGVELDTSLESFDLWEALPEGMGEGSFFGEIAGGLGLRDRVGPTREAFESQWLTDVEAISLYRMVWRAAGIREAPVLRFAPRTDESRLFNGLTEGVGERITLWYDDGQMPRLQRPGAMVGEPVSQTMRERATPSGIWVQRDVLLHEVAHAIESRMWAASRDDPRGLRGVIPGQTPTAFHTALNTQHAESFVSLTFRLRERFGDGVPYEVRRAQAEAWERWQIGEGAQMAGRTYDEMRARVPRSQSHVAFNDEVTDIEWARRRMLDASIPESEVLAGVDAEPVVMRLGIGDELDFMGDRSPFAQDRLAADREFLASLNLTRDRKSRWFAEMLEKSLPYVDTLPVAPAWRRFADLPEEWIERRTKRIMRDRTLKERYGWRDNYEERARARAVLEFVQEESHKIAPETLRERMVQSGRHPRDPFALMDRLGIAGGDHVDPQLFARIQERWVGWWTAEMLRTYEWLSFATAERAARRDWDEWWAARLSRRGYGPVGPPEKNPFPFPEYAVRRTTGDDVPLPDREAYAAMTDAERLDAYTDYIKRRAVVLEEHEPYLGADEYGAIAAREWELAGLRLPPGHEKVGWAHGLPPRLSDDRFTDTQHMAVAYQFDDDVELDDSLWDDPRVRVRGGWRRNPQPVAHGQEDWISLPEMMYLVREVSRRFGLGPPPKIILRRRYLSESPNAYASGSAEIHIPHARGRLDPETLQVDPSRVPGDGYFIEVMTVLHELAHIYLSRLYRLEHDLNISTAIRGDKGSASHSWTWNALFMRFQQEFRGLRFDDMLRRADGYTNDPTSRVSRLRAQGRMNFRYDAPDPQFNPAVDSADWLRQMARRYGLSDEAITEGADDLPDVYLDYTHYGSLQTLDHWGVPAELRERIHALDTSGWATNVPGHVTKWDAPEAKSMAELLAEAGADDVRAPPSGESAGMTEQELLAFYNEALDLVTEAGDTQSGLRLPQRTLFWDPNSAIATRLAANREPFDADEDPRLWIARRLQQLLDDPDLQGEEYETLYWTAILDMQVLIYEAFGGGQGLEGIEYATMEARKREFLLKVMTRWRDDTLAPMPDAEQLDGLPLSNRIDHIRATRYKHWTRRNPWLHRTELDTILRIEQAVASALRSGLSTDWLRTRAHYVGANHQRYSQFLAMLEPLDRIAYRSALDAAREVPKTWQVASALADIIDDLAYIGETSKPPARSWAWMNPSATSAGIAADLDRRVAELQEWLPTLPKDDARIVALTEMHRDTGGFTESLVTDDYRLLYEDDRGLNIKHQFGGYAMEEYLIDMDRARYESLHPQHLVDDPAWQARNPVDGLINYEDAVELIYELWRAYGIGRAPAVTFTGAQNKFAGAAYGGQSILLERQGGIGKLERSTVLHEVAHVMAYRLVSVRKLYWRTPPKPLSEVDPELAFFGSGRHVHVIDPDHGEVFQKIVYLLNNHVSGMDLRKVQKYAEGRFGQEMLTASSRPWQYDVGIEKHGMSRDPLDWRIYMSPHFDDLGYMRRLVEALGIPRERIMRSTNRRPKVYIYDEEADLYETKMGRELPASWTWQQFGNRPAVPENYPWFFSPSEPGVVDEVQRPPPSVSRGSDLLDIAAERWLQAADDAWELATLEDDDPLGAPIIGDLRIIQHGRRAVRISGLLDQVDDESLDGFSLRRPGLVDQTFFDVLDDLPADQRVHDEVVLPTGTLALAGEHPDRLGGIVGDAQIRLVREYVATDDAPLRVRYGGRAQPVQVARIRVWEVEPTGDLNPPGVPEYLRPRDFRAGESHDEWVEDRMRELAVLRSQPAIAVDPTSPALRREAERDLAGVLSGAIEPIDDDALTWESLLGDWWRDLPPLDPRLVGKGKRITAHDLMYRLEQAQDVEWVDEDVGLRMVMKEFADTASEELHAPVDDLPHLDAPDSALARAGYDVGGELEFFRHASGDQYELLLEDERGQERPFFVPAMLGAEIDVLRTWADNGALMVNDAGDIYYTSYSLFGDDEVVYIFRNGELVDQSDRLDAVWESRGEAEVAAGDEVQFVYGNTYLDPPGGEVFSNEAWYDFLPRAEGRAWRQHYTRAGNVLLGGRFANQQLHEYYLRLMRAVSPSTPDAQIGSLYRGDRMGQSYRGDDSLAARFAADGWVAPFRQSTTSSPAFAAGWAQTDNVGLSSTGETVLTEMRTPTGTLRVLIDPATGEWALPPGTIHHYRHAERNALITRDWLPDHHPGRQTRVDYFAVTEVEPYHLASRRYRGRRIDGADVDVAELSDLSPSDISPGDAFTLEEAGRLYTFGGDQIFEVGAVGETLIPDIPFNHADYVKDGALLPLYFSPEDAAELEGDTLLEIIVPRGTTLEVNDDGQLVATGGFSLDFVDVSFGPRAIGRLGLLAPKIYRRVRAVLRALPLPVPR